MQKESNLKRDNSGNQALMITVGLLVALFLLHPIISEKVNRPFSETLEWDISVGEYDFVQIECLADECHTEISFTQEDFGNITVIMLTKSNFLSFQSCSDFSAVNDLSISNKASHDFENDVIEGGDYYLVVDNGFCGTDEKNSDTNSTGTASVSTSSTGFLAYIF